jgi:hypothetical protein
MKAWVVREDIDYGGCDVVFSDTVSGAKKAYKSIERRNKCKFMDLRATRLKYADGKENLSKDDLTLFLLEHDWYFRRYPYKVDGEIKGYVSLDKSSLESIKELGFNNYLKKQARINNLKLTDFDYALLKSISKKYEWLVRNKDGTLYLFAGEAPNKDENKWLTSNSNGITLDLDNVLEGILWEDEPFNIPEYIN